MTEAAHTLEELYRQENTRPANVLCACCMSEEPVEFFKLIQYHDLLRKCLNIKLQTPVDDDVVCSSCVNELTSLKTFRDRVKYSLKYIRDLRNTASADNVEMIEANTDKETVPTTSTNKPPHRCLVCREEFTQYKQLTEHVMKRHTTDACDECTDEFTCHQCGSTFKKKKSLNQHMKAMHNLKETYKCRKCTQEFDSKPARLNHLVNSHMYKSSKHQCTDCSAKFNKRSNLKAHVKIVHGSLKVNKCGLCGAAFNKKATLQKHMIIHGIEKEYLCKKCMKKFPRKTLLKAHMKKHLTGKSYECAVCREVFIQKIAWKKHTRTHKHETTQDGVNLISKMLKHL